MKEILTVNVIKSGDNLLLIRGPEINNFNMLKIDPITNEDIIESIVLKFHDNDKNLMIPIFIKSKNDNGTYNYNYFNKNYQIDREITEVSSINELYRCPIEYNIDMFKMFILNDFDGDIINFTKIKNEEKNK
jgi:CBS domain containing-hemolysin-like protein